jgi:hypothetical protein
MTKHPYGYFGSSFSGNDYLRAMGYEALADAIGGMPEVVSIYSQSGSLQDLFIRSRIHRQTASHWRRKPIQKFANT